MIKKILLFLGISVLVWGIIPNPQLFAQKKKEYSEEEKEKTRREAEDRRLVINNIIIPLENIIKLLETGYNTSYYHHYDLNQWISACITQTKFAKEFFLPENEYKIQHAFFDKFINHLETKVKKMSPANEKWREIRNGLRPYHEDLKDFFRRYPMKQPK